MATVNDVSSIIRSIECAADALGVAAYGDDGRTFTSREYKAETKGPNIRTLQTLRDNQAVIIDHVETFSIPARLTISVGDPCRNCWYFKVNDRINIPAPFNEHDITLMLKTSNPIAVFSSMSADVAKFLIDNDVHAKDVQCCNYISRDSKTIVVTDTARVVIEYHPEAEGRRYYYRFDLCGYSNRWARFISDSADEYDQKAARCRAIANEKSKQAAELRKFVASLKK